MNVRQALVEGVIESVKRKGRAPTAQVGAERAADVGSEVVARWLASKSDGYFHAIALLAEGGIDPMLAHDMVDDWVDERLEQA